MPLSSLGVDDTANMAQCDAAGRGRPLHRLTTSGGDAQTCSLNNIGRRCTDLLVGEALVDKAVMGVDVERRIERLAGDLDMGRPATELLIGRDATFECRRVDLREEGSLGEGDLGGRRPVEPEPGPAISAGEGQGHISLQPVWPGAQAGKAAASNLSANLRHDMAHAVGFQLLRKRPLLLDIRALSLAKGAVDLGGAAEMDRLQSFVIDAGLVAGVFEHGERLAAAEEHDLGTLQLAPVEIRIRVAPGQEEAVRLVDLREMDHAGNLASRQRTERLAERRLHDMGRVVLQGCNGGNPRQRDRPVGLQPLFGQEAAGHCGDERRIEGREHGELDVESGHGGCSSRSFSVSTPVLTRQGRVVHRLVSGAQDGCRSDASIPGHRRARSVAAARRVQRGARGLPAVFALGAA